ncbi:MAG TPA: TolC family protein [Flavobacteriaceae bacterium]|nr:TolC family protein [Flavobacteriaceae bacterium]MCB9211883.1 TolC family protein [Alteromonas sp.]HPF10023.1 TolC family protein [Flavobacteriaceae bacterium]HQU21322.1 TolC family protein [Flavobacteriaceae bacterium]HQU63894.1 TolC family protein [Flavobacteriaceae bacterium]
MKFIFPILAIMHVTIGWGQEVRLLSQTEALEEAMENNKTVQISGKQMEENLGNYRQTQAIFLPNIQVSYTGITTNNPLMAFGSKLNQEILTPSDFDPNLLNNPARTTNFATKIEVQQPLINMDGVYQRKAAKAQYDASQLQWQRTKDYIVFETQKAYMQLQLAYQGLTVLNKAKEAAQANLKLAQNSFVQGYLQKADLLAVEVRVTEVENQLQFAKSQIKNASDYLAVLMGSELHLVLKPSDSLISVPTMDLSLDYAENRADIKAMTYASEAYKNAFQADKMAFLPRLNAFGSYELYDNEIFQADANGYLVGASLSWNVLDGSKRFGQTQKSKASYEKSKLELEQYKLESQRTFRQAKRMLEDAWNSLELSKLALQQSEESLRIRTNRYKEGLEKTSDLLMAETQYAQKQLEYYQRIFQYNYTQAYLSFLTKE